MVVSRRGADTSTSAVRSYFPGQRSRNRSAYKLQMHGIDVKPSVCAADVQQWFKISDMESVVGTMPC